MYWHLETHCKNSKQSKSPFGLKVLFGRGVGGRQVAGRGASSKSPFGLKVLFGWRWQGCNEAQLPQSKSPFGLKVLFGCLDLYRIYAGRASSKSPFGLKVLFGRAQHSPFWVSSRMSKSPFGLKVLFGSGLPLTIKLDFSEGLNHLSVWRCCLVTLIRRHWTQATVV